MEYSNTVEMPVDLCDMTMLLRGKGNSQGIARVGCSLVLSFLHLAGKIEHFQTEFSISTKGAAYFNVDLCSFPIC